PARRGNQHGCQLAAARLAGDHRVGEELASRLAGIKLCRPSFPTSRASIAKRGVSGINSGTSETPAPRQENQRIWKDMSCQSGLFSSISLIFHARGHFLMAFSRAIASMIQSYS